MNTRPANGCVRIVRLAAWPGLLIGMVAAYAWLPAEPAWARMWGLGLTGAFFGKLITATEPRTGFNDASTARKLAYLIWPGMTPQQFFSSHATPKPPAREWIAAISKFFCGIWLVGMGTRLVLSHDALLAGWTGMVGIVLCLHFGAFHLMSLAFRRAGIDARPIMDRPLLSTSLSDFWGARWNRAFSEPAFRLLCRPLARRIGLPAATLATFLASGLMHELVITIPARMAYGLPTLYFLAQGLAVSFERTGNGRAFGLGRGSRGRLFTLTVVATPVTILFPPVFVECVALPFLKVITQI